MAADAALIEHLRAELAAVADPARAPAMQAYMKSVMPYLGVPTTPLRAACRPVFDAHPLPTFAAWRDTVLALWRGARYREERYAAIELTGHRLYREWRTAAALPMYEEMIVTGAWWDLVDGIATDRVPELLAHEPAVMGPVLRRWSRSDDMWKRRASIICQVGRRLEVDTALLAECIEPSLESREFFLRKAIGWALRDYAWHNPEWVRGYVRDHAARLSSLSRREALKNVDRGLARRRRDPSTMSASTPGKPGRSPDSSAS